jgi:Tol biopolymer transport system component
MPYIAVDVAGGYNSPVPPSAKRAYQKSMSDTNPATLPPERPPEDRLDSWKEIAAYLNRDVTTVQRWEKREHMPVHRHLHDKAGSVYAFRVELDAWTASRNLRAATPENGSARSGNAPAPAAGSAVSSVESAQRNNRTLIWPLALAVLLALAIGGFFWLRDSERFWVNPVADARLQTITDSDGAGEAAAISRDGQFVAFLSDRDGPMDVWVTQVGSGQFHNLTRGSAPELVNPSVRTLGFTPDGSFVTYWVRKQGGSGAGDINIWAAPTLGGEPKPYLEGAAEFDWSRDGSQLVYHTPGPGDPMSISEGIGQSPGRPIFTAPSGLHSHFPLWSQDSIYIYFVLGALPDKLDIWRIPSSGGNAERITSHNSRVTHPVWLDKRTLLYLATDSDGSGPWLYSTDVERRVPHRLSSGLERYTSLAASADGRRLILTLASPKRTLWRLPIGDSQPGPASPARIPLTTSTGFSPRLGPTYLLYASAATTGESVWKISNDSGAATELWSGAGARILGGPAISADGRQIAFSVRQNDKTLLYTMQADGTDAHVVADSLDLQGDPAWAPDSQSITTAVNERGMPHLIRVPANGGAPAALVQEYSVDPAWAPDGRFAIYSGADVGTTFSVKAVASDGSAHALPEITLTRGARHIEFLHEGKSLIFLRGDLEHKDLWLKDLATGAERQLTNFPPGFNVRDFDISPDGREVVLERSEERADVVLMDLRRQ